MYLWAYAEDSVLAHELAEGWFIAQKNRNAYGSDPDSTACVLYAEVDAANDACIDCDAPHFQEKLTAYMRKLHGNATQYSDDDISIAYDTLISLVEQKTGTEICVVHARVAPPARMNFKEKIFIGYPLVHIVRRAVEGIRVRPSSDDWAAAV